jgi:hypothetical protein
MIVRDHRSAITVSSPFVQTCQKPLTAFFEIMLNDGLP